jgi:NADPH:quinone reductase-like Zn-dependent oxidoreductase
MVKAIVRDTYGQADVLRLATVDRPVPAAGEVLIEVHAAGVDQGVWHLMAGLPYVARLAGFGVRRPKNRFLGMDVAGRVVAAGPGVTGFAPGDEVFGTCDGSFAEFAVAKPAGLARKPANVSFEQAAALPGSGLAALQAIRDKGRLHPGQTALIIGAGGGVGHLAVQLVKAFGATVTGYCGPAKQEFVSSLGADEVLDYTRHSLAGRRFDLIVDIAGQRPLSLLRKTLTPAGTLVLVGAETGGRWLGGTERQLGALILSPFGKQRLTGLLSSSSPEDLAHLTHLMAAGQLTPAVDRVFPLERAAEAISYLRQGHAVGKVVIRTDVR